MWDPENEPDVFCKCENCGGEIYCGDQYYRIEIKDKTYDFCSDCIEDSQTEAYIEPYEPDGCDLAKERYYEEVLYGKL